MKLSTDEISWINAQLKTYKIPYEEIYEEIYDHVLSAIELKRKQGDEREMPVLFEEIITADFTGKDGMKMIARERYRVLQAALWQNLIIILKQNKNFSFAFSLFVLLGIYFLPFPVKSVNKILGLTCFTLALTPVAYLICINGFKNVLTSKSVKIRSMAIIAFFAMNIFNVLFCVIFNLMRMYSDSFKAMECNPLIYGVLLACLVVYVVSFIRLCNYQLINNLK